MASSAVLLLTAWLALPSVAQAQAPGVFVDPNSPAGKEYVIPLEEARRQGAGGGQGSAGSTAGGAPQPLFGEGIKPAPQAPGAPNGSSGSDAEEPGDASGSGAPNGRNGGNGGGSLGPESFVAGTPSAVDTTAGDSSGLLLTIALTAAVLAFGLLGGLGFRRLLRAE